MLDESKLEQVNKVIDLASKSGLVENALDPPTGSSPKKALPQQQVVAPSNDVQAVSASDKVGNSLASAGSVMTSAAAAPLVQPILGQEAAGQSLAINKDMSEDKNALAKLVKQLPNLIKA